MTTTAVKKLEKDCGELSPNVPNSQAWNEDNILPEEAHESYPSMTLEEFCANPPDNTEWIDGQIIEKPNMGAFHSKFQAKLAALLIKFLESHQIGGIIFTEICCQTNKQVRKPDLSYLSPEQAEIYGQTDFMVFPEAMPLVMEVISPTDVMDTVFAKVWEYLNTGSLEVWLVLPRQKLIIIASWQELEQDQRKVKIDSYFGDDIATSPRVLQGFSIKINEFFN